MKRTFGQLNAWPIYKNEEHLPRPWLEMCVETLRATADDVEDLHRLATKPFSRILLPKAQFDKLWAKPSQMIGSVILVPAEAYLARTHQPSLQELREYRGLGTRTCGMELEFEVFRGYTTSRVSADEYLLPAIRSRFSLHHGREWDAFREVYDDYRGIIRKLCDFGRLQFSTNSVIDEVRAVRSQKPVPKLDAFLHIKDLEPDNSWFELEYQWYPSTPYEEGLNAFMAQAILFTCVEKAALSNRARRDYLLDFWRDLEDSGSAKHRLDQRF